MEHLSHKTSDEPMGHARLRDAEKTLLNVDSAAKPRNRKDVTPFCPLPRVAILHLLFVACTWMGCGTVRKEIEHIHSLGNILEANPSDKQTLMQLAEYLNNPDGTLRTQAASIIGNLGAKHSEVLGDVVVPLLIARLKDDDAFVRRYAVQALGDYGKKAVPAVHELVEVLRNYKGADSGWFAADVLGDLGTAATPAVLELIRSLDYKGTGSYEFVMQESASIALFKLSPLGSEHVTELLKRVNTLSGSSQSYVALAILKSQPQNIAATEALGRVLTGQKFDPAAVALQEIEKLPVSLFSLRILLTALEQCSKSANAEVRELSSKQLARFGIGNR